MRKWIPVVLTVLFVWVCMLLALPGPVSAALTPYMRFVTASGWTAVFWTLFWCCVAVAVASVIYFVIRKFVLRAGAAEPREQI